MKRISIRFATAGALACVFLIAFVLCRCSHTVDINVPGDGEGGVSPYGTCVACHSSDEMVTLTARPIPPQEEGGEG